MEADDFMNTFFKRTFSTIVLLSLLAGSVFLPMKIAIWVFGVLCCLLTYGTAFELTHMINGKEGKDWAAHLSATACFLVTASTIAFQSFEKLRLTTEAYNRNLVPLSSALFTVIPLIIAALVWFAVLDSCNNRQKFNLIVNSGFAMFMVTISINCIVHIFFFGRWEAHYTGHPSYNFILLYFILVTKLGDIGAYVVGSLTNYLSHGHNHKAVPKISPGKSFEGAIGGIVTCVLGSLLLIHFFRHAEYHDIFPQSWMLYLAGATIGIVMYFGGAAGDLAESSIKRTCNVKDSGHFLPGIGGLFDLTDSLLLNAVLFVLVKEPIFNFVQAAANNFQ